jgi:hypothetical protein
MLVAAKPIPQATIVTTPEPPPWLRVRKGTNEHPLRPRTTAMTKSPPRWLFGVRRDTDGNQCDARDDGSNREPLAGARVFVEGAHRDCEDE